ncbi:MAG: pentapeptide repeat-containing protein [Pseudomonadota bacterium]
MANPDHVAKLLEGVEAWNQWREKNPDIVPDLFNDGKMDPLIKQMIEAGAVFRTRSADGSSETVRANLFAANLDFADLRNIDFQHATLSEAVLRNADLRGANFSGVWCSGTTFQNANVSTYLDNDGNIVRTELKEMMSLAQHQLDDMIGDSLTRIPTHLTRPDHWPRYDLAAYDEATGDGRSEVLQDKEIIHTGPFGTESRERARIAELSSIEIRASLERDAETPARVAHHLVQMIQSELAAHRMLAVPNDNSDGQLSTYNDKTNFLQEYLIAARALAEALPEPNGDEISDEAASTLKEKLIELRHLVDRCVKQLDADTGTYGALYKIGLISSIGGFLALFPGVGFAAGAAVAAGPIGVNTIRVIIDNHKD